MIRMGLTSKSQMSIAERIGIQQVESRILADWARRNTGAAIKATTAGRTPMKKCST